MVSPLYNLCENNYITSLVWRGGGVQLSSCQITITDSYAMTVTGFSQLTLTKL